MTFPKRSSASVTRVPAHLCGQRNGRVLQKVCLLAALGASVAAMSAFPPTSRAAVIDMPVEVQPGVDVGVGFGHLQQEANLLHIGLIAKNGTLGYSKWYDKSGRNLWFPNNEIRSQGPLHNYTVTGVLPNDGHAVRFAGNFAGVGTNPTVEFHVAVADIDVDVDSLGRHADVNWNPVPLDGDSELQSLEDASEVGDASRAGLGMPITDDLDALPATFPADNATGKALRVRLNSKRPGTLTFTGMGQHLGVYRLGKVEGQDVQLLVTQPITLTEAGIPQEVFFLHTRRGFAAPVTVEATFVHANPGEHDKKAIDKVRIYPLQEGVAYDLYVNTPATDDDVAPVEGKADRVPVTASVAPGTSGVAVRISDVTPGTTNETSVLFWDSAFGGQGALQKDFSLGGSGGLSSRTFWLSGQQAGVGHHSLRLATQAVPNTSIASGTVQIVDVTLRFRDESNAELRPDTSALAISNWKTDVGLPPQADFDTHCDDPSNFRIEVEGAETPDPPSEGVQVSLDVEGFGREDYTLRLKHPTETIYRSEFLRLVTFEADDAILGTQTRWGELGRQVAIYYRSPTVLGEIKKTISIGRPVTETYDGPVKPLQDIREVKLNVVVFSNSRSATLRDEMGDAGDEIAAIGVEGDIANARGSGYLLIDNELIEYAGVNFESKQFTTCKRHSEGTQNAIHRTGATVRFDSTEPSLERALLEAVLNTVERTFAQCAVRLKRPLAVDVGQDGSGKPLPPQLLGKVLLHDKELSGLEDFTAHEKLLITYKDAGAGAADSIDIFVVRRTYAVQDGLPFGARGYPARANQTGDPQYKNFIVCSSGNADDLPHEMAHILVNSAHRSGESVYSLLYPLEAGLGVASRRRIGPFPGDGPGHDDTSAVRGNSETLP